MQLVKCQFDEDTRRAVVRALGSVAINAKKAKAVNKK